MQTVLLVFGFEIFMNAIEVNGNVQLRSLAANVSFYWGNNVYELCVD